MTVPDPVPSDRLAEIRARWMETVPYIGTQYSTGVMLKITADEAVTYGYRDVLYLLGEVDRLQKERDRFFMGLAQIDYLGGTPNDNRTVINEIIHEALGEGAK